MKRVEKMKSRLLAQSKKEYPAGQRLLAILAAGVLFLVVFPIVLARASRSLDRILQWPRIQSARLAAILGGMMTVGGFLFALWSIIVQFRLGRGTPIPAMAAQTLIVQAPYAYTRNPMALGTIVMYLGVAVLLGSFSAVLMVMGASVLLLSYIRIVEEREMVARFGDAYRVYRRQTPFLLPRLMNNSAGGGGR
ncbi:MAG: isoprenylcysteine carboxylmethyltransferase family protein [Anaerolineae bacterium]|nr:isoprenylcysteine carboxylmethyltransferase family protein [Anaerolineae bacterium]